MLFELLVLLSHLPTRPTIPSRHPTGT
eukprot:SAG22_NODE_8698_length_636_cov_0.864060_1_plen_26_part_10